MGNAAAAKVEAKELAKKVEEIEDIMKLFKLRITHGLGVGAKPNTILPDGIELKLIDLDKRRLPQIMANKEAEALEKMAYVISAVAEVAIAKPPAKDDGKKQRKDFIRWAKNMREAAPGLAAAAKSKNPAEIQKAAAKINTFCNNCHSVFK